MRKAILGALVLCTTWAGVSSAATLTSTIEALQVVPAQNGVFFKLTNYSAIGEAGCSTNAWGYGDLDDQNFMAYVWPALMLAHSKGRMVTISYSGCQGQYPRISWIQVNAGTP